MKIRKLSATILTAFIICTTTMNTVIPPLTTEAHSGRTDSRGGHKDNKNKSGLGSYHYHHGYPAHLHTGGVCPYANGYTSSSSASASSSSTNTSNTSSTNTISNYVAQDSSTQTASTLDNTEVKTIIISDTSYDNVAFNASYYANKHKDVYDVYGDNAKALFDHFMTSGIIEGRQSSEQFSILVYKENNQDLVDVFGDDLIKYYDHFIECGYKENRVSR